MSDPLAFLAGGGEAARMIRTRDWSGHPLGPPEGWTADFKAALSLVLNSPESMILAWGPELSFFFNDTYFPLLGPRLPWAMGERFDKVWADAWVQAKPIIDDAFAGSSRRFDNLPWKLDTDRGAADTWFSFSYSRVLDAAGAVAGLFILTSETTAQVLGEAALRESEERLRLVVEGAKDHAILTTDPGGIVTSWSAGAEAILGWSAAEAVGRSASLIFTPEDRAEGADARELAAAAREGCAADERWHLTKSGQRVFLSGSMHPLPPDAQGRQRGFIKVARDETERRQAEDRLRREAERQRLSLQQMPGFAAILTGPEHVFEYVNDAYVTIAGPRAFVGRSVREVFPELAGQGFFELLDTVHATGTPFSARAMPIRLSGEGRDRFIDLLYQPIRDDAGTVSGIFVGGYDVSARMEAERALADLNASLQDQVAARTAERDQIWQASSDLLSVANFEGRFVSLNPAWTETLGWSEAEMKAGSFIDFVHPDDRDQTAAAAEGLARGAMQLGFENRYRARDGSYRWLSWNAVPREGLIYASVRDVTEIKAQAEALARTEEALRQSQKMEAVGQLTGGLAHDFNNLLAGISGSLELMDTRITQGRVKEVEKYMAAAQGAAKRAAALTHRLLAFSRRQTLAPKATNVNGMVSGMLDLVRRTVGPGIDVDAVLMTGLWSALVDQSQLENALLNLCINARDAMPEGGRITIETCNRWIDRHGARQHDLAEGHYLSLCVTDTGTGMTPEVVAKAFDPFFTTKPIGQGTGLGLSMIYGFAKQSGGQVRIHSEVGEGAMVCLYLPRHRGEAEADAAMPETASLPLAEAGETVLVVDDEPTVRMLVTDVLGDLGYTAIEAADGAGGLKVLQSDARIDLLVTDVGLPGGMNGRQMADAARLGRPGLKVLFITGFAENALLNDGQLEPGMSVLTKPFAVDTLAARIREVIAR